MDRSAQLLLRLTKARKNDLRSDPAPRGGYVAATGNRRIVFTVAVWKNSRTMNPITIELKLTSQEELQLAGILGKDVANLSQALAPHAQAALQEYLRMYLGQKVFTRGADMREYRLFLLVSTAFANRIPDEATVSALFQCTQSQSRALLRAVMSKYQYDLNKAIDDTLRDAVRGVRRDPGGKYILIAKSENIVDALNRLLASVDVSQDQVVRRSGKLGTYELTPSAYDALCTRFGIKAQKS